MWQCGTPESEGSVHEEASTMIKHGDVQSINLCSKLSNHSEPNSCRTTTLQERAAYPGLVVHRGGEV